MGQTNDVGASSIPVVRALALVLLVLLVLASSNIGASHAPRPHHVPVGIVGPAPVVSRVAQQLDARSPGALSLRSYPTFSASAKAIRERRIYGAFGADASRTRDRLQYASAASPTVSVFIQGVFTGAAGAQHATLLAEDLVPLPASDSRGLTTFSLVISLLIAGILGTLAIFLTGAGLTPGRRAGVLVAFAVSAGLVGALVSNVLIAAFPSGFLTVAALSALLVLAIAAPVAAFQGALGLAGTAVGVLAFLVIGSPASGGTSAPEFLPGFWRFVSQALPPGAATTAIRDGVYFSGNGSRSALLVLGLYAVLGLAGVLFAYRRSLHGASAAQASGPR